MSSVALIPALALVTGAAVGPALPWATGWLAWMLPVLCAAAVALWRRRSPAALVVMAAGCAIAGAALGAAASAQALRPALRTVLDTSVGDFDIGTLGPARDHDPLPTRAVALEDAAVRDGFVSLRVRVVAIAPAGRWQAADGGVSLSVSGDAAASAAPAWRAGRTIEAPVTFRRPARYLNDGVPDFEREAALGGTALFGSVKSALLVEVVEPGRPIDEWAADVRTRVRRAVGRWVAPHDPVAAAVVTAVLIGDRTGLPIDVRDRLQAAGTYHVIAISGGNIAILAGLSAALLMLAGVRGRAASAVLIAVLVIYAQIAAAGPSVWRATLMAALYFGARLLDHRTSAWQAAAVAAGLMVAAHPLDIRDPGFILTFGATSALLEAARLARPWLSRRPVVAWLAGSIAASLAVEVALLPVSAQVFSRVTSAGLLLNLIAVPMMGAAPIAGLVVVAAAPLEPIAGAAGWVAYAAADLLIESSRLVDVAPWLTRRVPPPGAAVVTIYYLSLALAFATAGWRRRAGLVVLAASVLVVGGAPMAWRVPHQAAGVLRWTVFDVGQAEATLLQLNGGALLIDAGGAPFGASSFDVGARVLAPALWARGAGGLEALLITHGDPDHVGGAPAIAGAFGPGQLWEGIVVPTHEPTRVLRDQARARGVRVRQRRAGEAFDWNGARVRVLHPPEPDWERPRIRNDDSVVLEVRFGAVALLLTGDISAEVERTIVPQLTPAPIRILKVAHHGSRTSTSRELVEGWRPQYAVISAGRGNAFGHPAPEVLRRLDAAGARVFRTDRDGQVTVEIDGTGVSIRTYIASHGDHGLRSH